VFGGAVFGGAEFGGAEFGGAEFGGAETIARCRVARRERCAARFETARTVLFASGSAGVAGERVESSRSVGRGPPKGAGGRRSGRSAPRPWATRWERWCFQRGPNERGSVPRARSPSERVHGPARGPEAQQTNRPGGGSTPAARLWEVLARARRRRCWPHFHRIEGASGAPRPVDANGGAAVQRASGAAPVPQRARRSSVPRDRRHGRRGARGSRFALDAVSRTTSDPRTASSWCASRS
jgi:hypothetical protein